MSPPSGEQAEDDAKVPLVVDVDGSLVSGDLLIEGAARLVAAHPLELFALPFVLIGGRAALKRRIARGAPLPVETLVLNPSVLDEIAAAKAADREIWLASGSDEIVVAPLAEQVGATGIFASDGRTNLVGKAKAEVLVERFGEGGFDYIGNERRDVVVWIRARRAIGVGLPAGLAREVRALDDRARLLPGRGAGSRDCIRALRPHQWIKNTLVFLPLVMAHELQVELYLVAACIFVALSACASGTYLLNDLLDLPHDRRHESKRHRPIAAGKVRPSQALAVGVALVAGGLAAAFLLPATAGLWICLYLATALTYALWLKRRLFADVVTLALLYTIRVVAGAVSVTLSPWLLAFSFFVFLALATVKRCGDLQLSGKAGPPVAGGRGYVTEDLGMIAALGAASGVGSAVVFALYIQSPGVSQRYAQPEFLWVICVLLVYWLGRLMLLANRGDMGHDPVSFALRDRVSWLIVAGSLAAFTAAL